MHINRTFDFLGAASSSPMLPPIAALAANPVTSRGDTTDVSFYGRLNRGIFCGDNDTERHFLFVGNNNISLRIGFRASAATGDLSYRAQIEPELESNYSINSDAGVSFADPTADVDLKERILQLTANLWRPG